MMNKANLKYLIPNFITFLSLSVGIGAILTAIERALILSATLIFLSYWLDMLDGFLARKLNAQTDFGRQLDSLVDMVSLGVAPAVLVFQHLRMHEASLVWVTPFVLLLVLAGAFRLARFNLLPAKTTKSRDSIGLTITQAGGTLALAVLADNADPSGFVPLFLYYPLLVILAGMMVSKIPFPPSSWFFGADKSGRLFLIILLLLIAVLPTFRTWFILYLVYIIISVLRALFFKSRTRVLP